MNKYVKVDGENLSTLTIVKKLRDIFFNNEKYLKNLNEKDKLKFWTAL